ncbi:hypothetical protein [Martelella alba]|uniref:Uncharacterized protein n=1 Tax=Martelella alba TaxID=2590451 RepID=A0ABY2SE32_9HYPH|nr:hypothetical protein [Martelella alba]TKI02415.1 hypothetical protein FCN80_25135 [Martelella alba]
MQKPEPMVVAEGISNEALYQWMWEKAIRTSRGMAALRGLAGCDWCFYCCGECSGDFTIAIAQPHEH